MEELSIFCYPKNICHPIPIRWKPVLALPEPSQITDESSKNFDQHISEQKDANSKAQLDLDKLCSGLTNEDINLSDRIFVEKELRKRSSSFQIKRPDNIPIKNLRNSIDYPERPKNPMIFDEIFISSQSGSTDIDEENKGN